MAGKTRLSLTVLITLVVGIIVILLLLVSPIKNILFESKSAPHLVLELSQEPLYAPEEEHFIFIVEASISGNPQPEITFSRDDSMGSLGPHQAMVYLPDGETFSLRAEAKNSVGEVVETIELVARLSDNVELAALEGEENDPGNESEQLPAGEPEQQPAPERDQEPDRQQPDNPNPPDANGEEPPAENEEPANGGDPAEENPEWQNIPQLPDLREPLELPTAYREIDGSRLSGRHLGSGTQQNPELDIATEEFTIFSTEQKLYIWLSLEYDNQPGYVSVALQYYDDVCCFEYVNAWVQNFFLRAVDNEERRYEFVFPEDYGFERDVLPPGNYRLTLYLENASAVVYMEQKALFTF